MASLLWTAIGVYAMIGGILLSRDDGVGVLCAIACIYLIGPFLCWAGVRVARGWAADTRPMGILSLAVGGVLLLGAGLGWRELLAQLLFGVPGWSLATAGVLALTGRRAYLRWRAARQVPPDDGDCPA